MRNRVEGPVQTFLSRLLDRHPHLPRWLDDAAATLPVIDFLAIFLAIFGLLLAVALSDQTWLLPLIAVMGVLGTGVSAAHWRAEYLSEIKQDKRGATVVRLGSLFVLVIFAPVIAWPIVSHLLRAQSGPNILPFTQGFLGFPLSCGDPSCNFVYTSRPYTSSIMYSVMDHSLKQNSNSRWQYGSAGRGSGNGVIIAFNGERANGPRSDDDPACISGEIHLAPAENVRDMVIHPSLCGAGFASYDESIGYDFRAAMNTPVQSAAEGVVVSHRGEMCIITDIPSCRAVNSVGIDHGNGYITQYGYLSTVSVRAGERVKQGDQIGLSGNKGTTTPRLHFEVLKLIPGHKNDYSSENYAVVDPYGWVGHGIDPLYSVRLGIPSAKLWQ